MFIDSFMFSGSKYEMISIMGATATGKTQVAVHLAACCHGAVISADSRQVYKHMNLGTGKDLEEYCLDGTHIPYHLIDIREPGAKYNVYEYQKDFFEVYEKIKSGNLLPIMCGGSGMYIQAVLDAYQLIQVPHNTELRFALKDKSLDELTAILTSYKNTHNRSDTDNVERAIRAIEIADFYAKNSSFQPDFPKLKALLIGIEFERSQQRSRITARLKQRLKAGMVDEVKALLENGIPEDTLIYYGLEYKFITLYLTGKITYQQMFAQLETAIHQFAKRQNTWFRKMEKDGHQIHWLNGNMPLDEKIQTIEHLFNKA